MRIMHLLIACAISSVFATSAQARPKIVVTYCCHASRLMDLQSRLAMGITEARVGLSTL